MRDGLQCDYADVADALVDWRRDALPQLESLFARVVLNIALQNAYGQLRNPASFEEEEAGFSPVFDVNINPDPGKQRATSVSGEMRRSKIDGQR